MIAIIAAGTCAAAAVRRPRRSVLAHLGDPATWGELLRTALEAPAAAAA